ncbi:MAG: AAA family ATPase, partial [Saprospiraceae bacterium]
MFPYIKQIKVNNCYTYQNFNIIDKESKEFKHIILTGKNGSGKTTILNRIGFLLQSAENGHDIIREIQTRKNQLLQNDTNQNRQELEQALQSYNDIELDFFNDTNEFGLGGQAYSYFSKNKGSFIFSFFRANRKIHLNEVQSVTKEADFVDQLYKSRNPENFIRHFKQYIVNKKVFEAFDFMNSKTDSIKESRLFFDKLTLILRSIFKDNKIELEFVQENFEFYLILGDLRRVTFNQLSDGFSAFLNILMDLIMRIDLIRKQTKNFEFNPPGIVLIDEPETHFHIEMQYE